MKTWEISRVVGSGALTLALSLQASPMVWAQLESATIERDPVLASTIEAATRADPDFQRDPELKTVVEKLTTDCLKDPETRAVIAHEVTQVRAEGGVEHVIPHEVLAAVRTETSTTFSAREADMKKALETLPPDSKERKMAELSMEHGRQVMEAYAKGEAAPPPPREMVAHAQEMFKEWTEKSGASARDIEAAKYAMERFAKGEIGPMGPGGPGGFGPGQNEMGPPSEQQLKAMADAGKITPEQLAKMQADKQAWESGDAAKREELMKQYAGEGFHGGVEGMPHGGFEGFGGAGPREGFGPVGTEHQEGFSPRDAFEHWAATEGHNVSPEQLERYRDIAQQVTEARQQQQQTQAEVKTREYHHIHPDGTDHLHEVFHHPNDPPGVCHDHGTNQPTGC